jgi:hypothetical protein
MGRAKAQHVKTRPPPAGEGVSGPSRPTPLAPQALRTGGHSRHYPDGEVRARLRPHGRLTSMKKPGLRTVRRTKSTDDPGLRWDGRKQLKARAGAAGQSRDRAAPSKRTWALRIVVSPVGFSRQMGTRRRGPLGKTSPWPHPLRRRGHAELEACRPRANIDLVSAERLSSSALRTSLRIRSGRASRVRGRQRFGQIQPLLCGRRSDGRSSNPRPRRASDHAAEWAQLVATT